MALSKETFLMPSSIALSMGSPLFFYNIYFPLSFTRFSCSHAHLPHLGNSLSLVGINPFKTVVLSGSCTAIPFGELLKIPMQQE